MHYRNFDQIFLCIFNTFCNRFLNFFCFSQTMTHNSIFITHNHKCRKTKSTATLGCFYNPVNSHNFFFQFKITGFNSV